MDSGSANHEVAVAQVFGIVADGDLNTHGTQMLYGVTFRHIGTLDRQTHAAEDFCQGAHGYAADADQVDTLAGHQIITNGMGIVHHGGRSSFPKTLFAV